MAKTKVTRTYGPIHFEDLDPHRFEDLIRELIYDYKDWLTIEATGRSGNDSGFDIRAYEKSRENSTVGENDEGQEEIHPMQGNLWMIQGKREKGIGPKRIKEILSDVDSKNPPYGYILAASANFSKDSYDIFRDELRKKGVMEFYLWGKAELEDMLHLPKNDRILFTFFGISIVSKRRSRATEIRQVVVNKNKLYRILGEGHDFYKSVLLRDSKDLKYPYKAEYKDFEKRPRWSEYKAVEYHPGGLIVALHKHFAYIDTEKKEYDYTDATNLIFRESDSQEERNTQQANREKVENYWEHLPRRNQATFMRNGLVRYDEMLVIDDKGDSWHKFPHIFTDFDSRFSDQDFNMLKHGNEMLYALYECDDRYKFLKPKDIVKVENQDTESSSTHYLRITYAESVKLKDYFQKYPDSKWMVERQIGENPDIEKTLNIYEFKKTYDFVVEREKEKIKNKK